MTKRSVRIDPPGALRTELDAFDREVEAALEHVADAQWLGERSPLAAPYFLGEALAAIPPHEDTNHTESTHARGAVLARLLRECAANLDNELHAVVQVAWLARNPAYDNVAVAMALNMSERTFYRARNLAIKSVARALHGALAPPVRLERPVAARMAGRDGLCARVQELLAAGRSVYLTGPGGIGKSTLAAAVAAAWQAEPKRRLFWYTMRSHANDHIASFHFALAWFLHSAGAGNSWRQLVADHTMVDLERALSLLRFDLASLPRDSLLFCIDDVDVLGDDLAEHAQIVPLLELLRTHAPLLLIGQRIVAEADEVTILGGLDESSIQALFADAGAPAPTPEAAAVLAQGTGGNPALLRLIASLARQGDDPLAALAALGEAPTLEALFHRHWRRLDDAERNLAFQLSVFHTAAPDDVWADDAPILARLTARGLLVDDGQGAVAVQPHLRAFVEAAIPAEARPQLHAHAADVRAARAEYTRAVAHAIAAHQPARAVWLWFANRDREIDRGQGAHALQLLRAISLDDLEDPRDRTALLLARAELLQLEGRAEEALAYLRTVDSAELPAQVTAYVQLQRAQAEEMTGRTEQALESYRRTIDAYLGLPAQHEIIAHLRLSFMHMYRRNEVDAARRQALLARAKAEAFYGDLETAAGNYTNALSVLHAAEAKLDEADDLATRARVCHYLSVVYARLGDYMQSFAYLDQAVACDLRRGDAVGVLYSRLNRAWLLNQLGRCGESEAEARNALHVAEAAHNVYLVAGLAAGVAEACQSQCKWDEALHFALYSLEQEEVYFRAEALVVLGAVRAQQQRHADATQVYEEAVAHAQEIGDRAIEAYVWRAWGAALGQASPQVAAQAQGAFARAAEIYSELGLTFAAESVAALRTQLPHTRPRARSEGKTGR